MVHSLRASTPAIPVARNDTQQRYYVTRREKYTAGVGMRATNAL